MRPGVLAALAACWLAGPALAEFDATHFSEAFKRIDEHPGAAERHAACPADIFRTRAPFWLGIIDGPEFETEQCQAEPSTCIGACLDAQGADACFSMALAMQSTLGDEYAPYFETLFAEACATGSDGGCTNRAAGIRNGGYAEDPFRQLSGEEIGLCTRRTFALTCSTGDAWGCTMSGQALLYGEGGPQDVEAARDALEKACAIDPDFEACNYARSLLANMDEMDEQPPR